MTIYFKAFIVSSTVNEWTQPSYVTQTNLKDKAPFLLVF